MRALPLILVAIVPFSTGCKLFKLTAYNAYVEPIAYADDECIRKRAIKIAKEAWLNYISEQDGPCPPAAYERGYIDGYSDYLLYGGNGAPPTIPPFKLRTKKNLNPDGHDEIEEYYAGFVAGAADAKASGLREYFVIPISTPLPFDNAYDDQSPAPAKDPPMEPDPREVLPTPKPLKIDEKEMGNRAPSRLPILQRADIRKPDQQVAEPPRAMPNLPRLMQAETARPHEPEIPTATPLPSIQPRTPESALPREFSVPILNGPGSR